jgi:deoxyribodipyrimidine photo-lyase
VKRVNDPIDVAGRVRPVNDRPVNYNGDYVLHWMTSARRAEYNHALDRSAAWARALNKPLIVLEAIGLQHPWASSRFHSFIIQGMADQMSQFQKYGVRYLPYIEKKTGEGKGLIEALSANACLVVTDDWPCFITPKIVKAAGEKSSVHVEAVDIAGLLPVAAVPKVFARAYHFRLWHEKNLHLHLENLSHESPLVDIPLEPEIDSPILSASILDNWEMASEEELANPELFLGDLPIDQEVKPVKQHPGGAVEANKRLDNFVSNLIDRYGEDRNQPEKVSTSTLSSYLHFGHISSQQIWQSAADADAGENGSAFIDQLITWRELGFNFCHYHDEIDTWESLPEWARKTLDEHADDVRPVTYSLEEMEAAETHDEIWNSAQRQLVGEGIIHNYLRMLWGKKILEWSSHPKEALNTMIHLNNRWALDGRDPNSYSGITWCLGRYDRAWGPERPIFGKIRYMSSDNTARKLRIKPYLERWSTGNLFSS